MTILIYKLSIIHKEKESNFNFL